MVTSRLSALSVLIISTRATIYTLILRLLILLGAELNNSKSMTIFHMKWSCEVDSITCVSILARVKLLVFVTCLGVLYGVTTPLVQFRFATVIHSISHLVSSDARSNAGLMLQAFNLRRRPAFDDGSLAPYRDARNFRVLGLRIFTRLNGSNTASEVYLW